MFFEVVENSLLFMILMASCNKIMPPYLVPSANRLYIGGLVGRSSWPIMVSYGNKYPRHNARPLVAKQSGPIDAVCGISNLVTI